MTTVQFGEKTGPGTPGPAFGLTITSKIEIWKFVFDEINAAMAFIRHG